MSAITARTARKAYDAVGGFSLTLERRASGGAWGLAATVRDQRTRTGRQTPDPPLVAHHAAADPMGRRSPYNSHCAPVDAFVRQLSAFLRQADGQSRAKGA